MIAIAPNAEKNPATTVKPNDHPRLLSSGLGIHVRSALLMVAKINTDRPIKIVLRVMMEAQPFRAVVSRSVLQQLSAYAAMTMVRMMLNMEAKTIIVCVAMNQGGRSHS